MTLSQESTDKPPGQRQTRLYFFSTCVACSNVVSTASVQIHVPELHAKAEAEISGPDLPEKKQSNENGGGEKVLEEDLRIRASSDGEQRGIKCGDEADDDYDEADVGSVNSEARSEGQFFQSVISQLPSTTESNVAETDGAPDEEGGESGQGQEPVENRRAYRCFIDKGQ